MKKSISLLILMLLICSSGFSQTRIKTLFYNLLYYPSGAPNDRELILKSILDTYNPDIFTVCELETVEGADEILSQSIQTSHPNFASATFVTNQSDPSADNQLQQLLYYNTDLFTLESEQVQLTYIRDINQYTLLLRSEDDDINPIIMELETTKTILSVDKPKFQSQFNILGSNLINSDVSIYISSDFYNSKLLIHNQLGQLVKTIHITTENQILTDVCNLSNGVYFITSSIKNHVNPIKFLKIN